MNKIRTFTVISAVLIGTSGCSLLKQNNSLPQIDILKSEKSFAMREASLARRELELDSYQQELDTRAAKQNPKLSFDSAAVAQSNLLPPNAIAGACYARLWMPDEYKSVKERVISNEAAERIDVTPATYKTSLQQFVVEEASTKLIAVPATFKFVPERILVKYGSTEIVSFPAVYETITERILVSPAHTVWKKGTGPIQRLDETTGEIMCLVDVPALYDEISRRVLKSPATTKVVELPAIYKTIQKKVIATPPTTRTVVIPAKYKTVKVTEVDTPASEKHTKIPATYTTITHTELVKTGHMQWRSILCETNSTPTRIRSIQQALIREGHDPGPVDGFLGVDTMRAVNAYQSANGLPIDKYLNIKTVKALGVSTQ